MRKFFAVSFIVLFFIVGCRGSQPKVAENYSGKIPSESSGLSAQSIKQPVFIEGKCIRVSDGDTIVVNSNNEEVKVRLSGIDAPEKAQPFGTEAKEFTYGLVNNKDVKVEVVNKDMYGRTVGNVFIGDTYLNRELVKNGLAWWYKEYDPNNKEFSELELNARAKKIGLWKDSNPKAPWEYRKEKKAK